MNSNLNILNSSPDSGRVHFGSRALRSKFFRRFNLRSRLWAFVLCLTISLLAAVSPSLRAEKIYHIGNSHTIDMSPNWGLREMGKTQGVTIDNGWHIYGGHNLRSIVEAPTTANDGNVPPTTYGTWQTALAKNNWDIITLQTFGMDNGATTAKQEEQAAITLINYALDHNTDGTPPRFFLYTTWVSISNAPNSLDYSQEWERPFAGANNPFIHHTRVFNEWLKTEIATENLRGATVETIPVGEVMYEFDQAAKAGKIPGFSSAKDLYRDQNIHLNGLGSYLASLTVYSKIHGIDARLIGLPDKVKWAYNGFNDPRLNLDTCLIMANLVNKVLSRGAAVPVTLISLNATSLTLLTTETRNLIATIATQLKSRDSMAHPRN
jgi:hypothetical protein